MIKDTDNVRLLGFAVDVEQGETIEGSLKIDCQTGWGLSGDAVDDCTFLIKHSGEASYTALEDTHINLEVWDGTTQTFNYRIIAGASAIYKERVFPLRVSRFTPASYGTNFVAASFTLTGQAALFRLFRLSADPGSFALTGQDVTLEVPYTFSDADAEAFSDEIGTLSALQKEAIDNLVIDLKAASLWTEMVAIYPFVGGTSTAHSYNLKNPALYQITWNGTVTHNANGITGNGTDGYGDTGLNANSVLTQYDTHLSVYSKTSASENGNEIGAGSFVMGCRQSGNIFLAQLYSGSGFGEMNGAASDGSGLFTATIRAITDREIYRNSTSLQTRTGSTASSLPNENIGICATISGGGAGSYSSRNLAWVSIGLGLSDADVSALTTVVQDYQTALSR